MLIRIGFHGAEPSLPDLAHTWQVSFIWIYTNKMIAHSSQRTSIRVQTGRVFKKHQISRQKYSIQLT